MYIQTILNYFKRGSEQGQLQSLCVSRIRQAELTQVVHMPLVNI